MTTLPRPSRPSINPPTSPLPPVPSPKSRKTLYTVPEAAQSTTRIASLAHAPTKLKPPNSPLPSADGQSLSTSNLPTLGGLSTPGVNGAGRSLRKTVSISSFPQPPKSGKRLSSLPASPLVGPPRAGSANAIRKRESSDSNSPITPDRSARVLGRRSATQPSARNFTGSSTPSFLNGNGESVSISSAQGAQGADGLLGLPSPPQSRSSSAEGSYSTTATTFEDGGDSESKGKDGTSAVTDKRSSKTKEGKGNVIVSVRVRPDAGNERSNTRDGEWNVDSGKSLISYRGREGGDYYYDNVFGVHDNNAKVYDSSAKRLVRRVMEGYHGTVFAYGMTGTGKTFSMQGTSSSPGVIPLAITDIFSYIRETPHREFLLRVSYLEIYNEKIYDLLSPPTSTGLGISGLAEQEEIKLREDSKRGVYATPLKEEIVQSPTQLLRVIARGDHARRTGSTQFNARSSRSHAVVQIVVESRERLPGAGVQQDSKRAALVPGGVRVSTLSLIDLAGSERAAENKERRTEGAHINKSLLTLGTVIARLSEDKDKHGGPADKEGKHLPYRDSKLTRLLQPALSGNSLVSILCTIQTGSAGSVAGANTHAGETLNTLKFAARAKNNIVSHAKKAEEAYGSGSGDAGSRVLLERYRMEIQQLRTQLDDQAKLKSIEEERLREKEAEQRHGEQMLEMQLARTALKERIEHLNRLILSSKSIGVNSNGSFSALGMHSRISLLTNPDMAPSVRSSASTLGATRDQRTTSTGSVSTIGQSPIGQPSGFSLSPEADEEDSAGEFGDGTASHAAQVSALQADLADKNRYISTLEKRLLQARRSSHSRTSIALSPSHRALADDGGLEALLKEKDAEIADLRARLDDKDRMVTALRSAARKREVADLTSEASLTSNGDSTAKGAASEQSSPVGPMALLSPGRTSTGGGEERTRPRSVDEMSRILDEMIQDRVENGQLVKGSHGSIRLAGERRAPGLGGLAMNGVRSPPPSGSE